MVERTGIRGVTLKKVLFKSDPTDVCSWGREQNREAAGNRKLVRRSWDAELDRAFGWVWVGPGGPLGLCVDELSDLKVSWAWLGSIL